jgi:hypothetical protein
MPEHHCTHLEITTSSFRSTEHASEEKEIEMQITTTRKAPSTPLATHVQNAQSSCHLQRPDHESWYVGEDKFQSTEDMLSSVVVEKKGTEATYSYQEQSELDRDLWGEVPGRIAKGAVYGAIAGAGVGAAMLVVGGVLDALTLGSLGMDYSFLKVVPLMGAGMGAFVGPMDLFESHGNYKEFGQNISGALVKSHNEQGEEQVSFHPGRSLEESIDLGDFAKAPVHVPSEGADCKPWWKGRGYTPQPG